MERYLIPQDFMVYLEFNPRDYKKYWRFAQPEGNLVFRDLDPKVQATMLRLLMDKKNAKGYLKCIRCMSFSTGSNSLIFLRMISKI
jgi:hypothetical protein